VPFTASGSGWNSVLCTSNHSVESVMVAVLYFLYIDQRQVVLYMHKLAWLLVAWLLRWWWILLFGQQEAWW
jgi:hypothetical protein